jgi:hypothetical protein
MSGKPLSLEFSGSFLIASRKLKMNVAHSNVERLCSSPFLLGRSTSVINPVWLHGVTPRQLENTPPATRRTQLST